MAVQILFRRGTASEWTSANPVLGNGEPGVETDTGRFKIGNGSGNWNSLSYATGAGGSVSVLADLTDVAATAPSSGQVLKWSGSQWAPAADNNTNTTYTVSAETATGGADIRLTGSDATTDFVRLTAGSNVTITRTSDSAITITSTATGGASNLDGLSDVTLTSPTSGQVLKYNGTNWVNDTDLNNGLGSVALNDITDVIVTGPSNGQVLKYNGTNWVNGTDATGGTTLTSLDDVPGVVLTSLASGQVLKYNGTNWVNGTDASGGGALPTRAVLSGATGSLANGATGTVNLTGYSVYSLLKVQTSAASWVRIYVSDAARVADASRTQGVDPLPGSGVIAEVITTTAETVLISPGTIGFNDESTVTTNIPMRVTNLSGSTAAITVSLTAIQLEA